MRQGKSHVVDEHCKLGDVTSLSAGIDKKIYNSMMDDTDGVECELFIVGSEVQHLDVNFSTGKKMEIILGELEDDGSNGSVLAHGVG
jgi:hypothetical protein